MHVCMHVLITRNSIIRSNGRFFLWICLIKASFPQYILLIVRWSCVCVCVCMEPQRIQPLDNQGVFSGFFRPKITTNYTHECCISTTCKLLQNFLDSWAGTHAYLHARTHTHARITIVKHNHLFRGKFLGRFLFCEITMCMNVTNHLVIVATLVSGWN